VCVSPAQEAGLLAQQRLDRHGAERQREHQLRAALDQIEQQQQANDLLRREVADQALRDPSSGLYRRAHFEDQLRREVDLSTREHREFAIVFIEIDPPGAKVLALGETGRQRILEAMGRLLRGGTRAMDASCRYDENRFAVLLSGVGLATAHARMEGLRRKCATQIVVHEGQEMGFTVSMGVASFPHTAHTQETLQVSCEAALTEARRRGGNHVTLAAIRFEAAEGLAQPPSARCSMLAARASSRNANKRLSVATFSRCAARAPTGARLMLAMDTTASAGR
jgi:diguanylate cyclase (GGDEF)-like protein